MALFTTRHVAVRGISAAVPKAIQQNREIYAKWGDPEQFISTTGVRQKRVASVCVTSSDLCLAAAERLVSDLGWSKDEIDAVVFVSQTPDYRLPATSCVLQERLGLSQNCYTLDISLGCSGWVYGMSVAASLMQNGGIRKGLLMAGDTILKLCSENDKSTYPLFGDAGTCTALEFDEAESSMTFAMHTDGSGKGAIIVGTVVKRIKLYNELIANAI